MSEVLTMGEPMGLLIAENPGPLKDVTHFSRAVCGAEVNFSIGLSRLGHSVSYVSCVGKDPFGEHIADFLQENGIDTRYLSYDEEHITGMQIKEKVTDGHDPYVFNSRKHTAFSHFDPESLSDISWDDVKHVHVTGIPAALSENCFEASRKLMELARMHNVRISFDPNLRPMLWSSKEKMVSSINSLAKLADIVMPGIGEGETLMGSRDPEKISDFYIDNGAKTVVVKLGTKGSFVKQADGTSFIAPAFKVEHVVDTVGAGDGFAVGTISALLEGLTIQDAVRRGAAIGALAVMSPGDNEGLPDREKLERFMEAV